MLTPNAKAIVGNNVVVHPHSPLPSKTVDALVAGPDIFALFLRVFFIEYIAIVVRIDELAINRKIKYVGIYSMTALPPWMYARYQKAAAYAIPIAKVSPIYFGL